MEEQFKERCDKLISFIKEYEIAVTNVKTLKKTDERDMFIITGDGLNNKTYTVLMTFTSERDTRFWILGTK